MCIWVILRRTNRADFRTGCRYIRRDPGACSHLSRFVVRSRTQRAAEKLGRDTPQCVALVDSMNSDSSIVVCAHVLEMQQRNSCTQYEALMTAQSFSSRTRSLGLAAS